MQQQLEQRAGLDVKCKDKRSWAVLWPVTASGQDVVKLLLEKDAELESKGDYDGRTPLWRAADNSREAVVKLLLEKGAELESKGLDGRTPLSWVAENGHEAVVKRRRTRW